MSRDHIFGSGSLAQAYLEIADWYGKHTDDIAHGLAPLDILFPFFGFGRITSAMCQDDTHIDTCDFLHHSGAIVEGIFTATKYETNVDKPRFHKGTAVAGGFLKDIDQHSAGFIDWVVAYGTPLDPACIGMVIPGQTMRGWLSKWTGNFDKLWDKFITTREECKQYIPMPGGWRFFEADFFELLKTGKLSTRYDVLAIDPPRLCTTRDLYSRGWRNINELLGGSVRIKPWTDRNYHTLLDKVLQIDSDYILLTWTEGQPSTESIKTQLLSYGTLEDEVHWEAFTKSIYGWRIKREVHP